MPVADSKSGEKASNQLDEDHTLVSQLQGGREGEQPVFSFIVVGGGFLFTLRHTEDFPKRGKDFQMFWSVKNNEYCAP